MLAVLAPATGMYAQAVSPVLAPAAPPAASADKAPDEPNLKLSPTALLKQFEPPADEEYTLGPGDGIAIDFPSRPELSTKGVVGPDGMVSVPVAGATKVAGLTRDAAGKVIGEKMSKFYKDIDATVRIEKYGSNNVTVIGNVTAPGTYNFEQTPTLLAVLTRGGVVRRADGSLPDQIAIYRGDNVMFVDLEALMASGSPLSNLRLRRDDLVFVPALSAHTISVMGQVQHQGQISLKHDSTLASVLAEAGGLADGAGSNPELQIVHRSKGNRTQYVRFKDMLKPSFDISLYPGDVIYVPKSGLARTGFVMQQIAPFFSVGTFAAVLMH
jgi:polysaccharide export outer membrane protein